MPAGSPLLYGRQCSAECRCRRLLGLGEILLLQKFDPFEEQMSIGRLRRSPAPGFDNLPVSEYPTEREIEASNCQANRFASDDTVGLGMVAGEADRLARVQLEKLRQSPEWLCFPGIEENYGPDARQ